MAWRRDLRLLAGYSSYHAQRFDLMAAIGVPVLLGFFGGNQSLGPLVGAIACLAYLAWRVRTARRLARLDFERGGTVLHARAEVRFGGGPAGTALHPGQPIVVEVDEVALDASCLSGVVPVGTTGTVTVVRLHDEAWPRMSIGDELEFVALSGTVAGVLVAEMLRDPERTWLGGRD